MIDYSTQGRTISQREGGTLSHPEAKLTALRAALAERGIDGFIVPKSDAFQNESVPASEDRLRWLTGFTGSAGTAVILHDRAVLLADSRYTLQAKAQAPALLFDIEQAPPLTVTTFLERNLKKGSVIGYDPRLHTVAGFKSLRERADKSGFVLEALHPNPIDALWHDRPAMEWHPIFMHSEDSTGEGAASKISRVRDALVPRNCSGLFLSSPASVAWLMNIRGSDTAHTPLPLVYAYLPSDGKPMLFVQAGHIGPENRSAIEAMSGVYPIGGMEEALRETVPDGASVQVDADGTTVAIATLLERAGARVLEAPDPCVFFRARKNAVELAGARAAQKRDGVAVCRFLSWLDREATTAAIDEIAASDRLEGFRRESGLYRGPSFDTISGAGPNGAIVHYRATPDTNRRLMAGSLYLIDSGGQYDDGTTDVTRTVVIGEPAAAMRQHFTLVLKGHIAVAAARFPAGTRGVDLDPFARRALWDAGLDYGHGTGHGVGSFSSVHEGPQSISRNGMTALEPGMIVSNEPGYYREDEYGIRIENLLAVTEAKSVPGGDRPVMSFETLTLAPIDRRLIDLDLLSGGEIEWINTYHERVRSELGGLLSEGERAWLLVATAPLDSDIHV